MTKNILFLTLIALFLLTTSSFAEIKTQWRGQNRDGVYSEINLLKQWPANGPKLLWAVDVSPFTLEVQITSPFFLFNLTIVAFGPPGVQNI